MVFTTRPKDCQQKNAFKTETLNIHTIFAPKSGTQQAKRCPQT